MALLMQPTTMNVPEMNLAAAASGEVVNDPMIMDQSLLQLKQVDTITTTTSSSASQHSEAESELKKRPLSEAATSEDTTAAPSNKRQRRERRRVQFQTDAETDKVTHAVREFEIDYEADDVWWTNEQSQEHMERQSSLLQFYANNCQDLVDSVLLVWVNCAEEALADGTYCMTKEQRATVAQKVAQSPIRGFEKELAVDLITEQRNKTIHGILELQMMCQQNNVPHHEQVDAISAASTAFSQTATIFAHSIARADRLVADTHHQQPATTAN